MSETNAISGIIVAGCMVTLRTGTYITDSTVIKNFVNNAAHPTWNFNDNENI